MTTGVEELRILSLNTTYEIDGTFDSEKFMKVRLRVCHDGKNPNGSYFELEDMEKAKDSLKNIPILANVVEDEDGNLDFGAHDMKIEENKMNEDKDDEDKYKLIYLEIPIGLIPEDNNYTIEEYNGRNYVYCDGYVWREYSNYSEDILERDKNKNLSMEILVDSYEYNIKENYFKIKDYRYQGITLLGDKYGTGMKDAKATTDTFFNEDKNEKIVNMMEELKNSLSNYNQDNNNKGGSIVNEEVKALLDKFNVKPEDLSFDITDMKLEDIEAKLNELYSDDSDSGEDNNDDVDSDNDNEDNDTSEDENEDNEEDTEESYVKSFELSHDDIRWGLYQLLEPIEEDEDEIYIIDQVYDDYFEYVGLFNGKIWRQGYTKDNESETVELVGDRIELFQERLTKEEKEELDAIRNNYTKLKEEVEELRSFKENKEKQEREQEEQEFFSQFDDKLKDNEEYKELKKNASNYTFEELEKEVAFIMFKLDGNFKFKSNTDKKDKVKVGFSKKKKDENEDNDDYGRIISKYSKKQ